MSAASHNRGSRALSARVDRDLAAALPGIERRELHARLSEANAELAAARLELQRAKLRIRLLSTTLTIERGRRGQEIAEWKTRWSTAWNYGESMRKRWQWVSGLVRTFLTPAQVEMYRSDEAAAEQIVENWNGLCAGHPSCPDSQVDGVLPTPSTPRPEVTR